MKWRKNTGEYKIRKRLESFYEIHLFGREGWIGLDNLGKEDRKLSEEGLKFAKYIEEKKPHLLVLDEVNLAIHYKMLKTKDVIEFLDSVPEQTDVVLTGRYAPQELIDRADFVNEVNDIKQPKEMVTTKVIQY